MTRPEVVLWISLKGRNLDGLKFRRQHPLGPYILDFYCHAAKLCVEVDGGGHSFGRQPLRDQLRDAWLESVGVRTLRISAATILEDADVALRTILAAARNET
jgi:very-short-patch-repair endonuclease